MRRFNCEHCGCHDGKYTIEDLIRGLICSNCKKEIMIYLEEKVEILLTRELIRQKNNSQY